MKAVAAGIAAVALLLGAAVASGAFATKFAASPSRTPCTVLTPGDHTVNVLDVDGELRPVLLHVPKTGAYTPRPLVIALHGAGENGPRFEGDTGFSKLADREGFLVAYPTAVGPNSFWDITGQTQKNLPEETEQLERSLDALEGVACVDRSRVFATGVSNGGGMTARLACELSDRLAGAAPVAGGYRALPPCHPDRPIPILEIHGTGDQVVPYGGIAPKYAGSVLRYLARWRRIDGCVGTAQRSAPAPGVHEFAWKNCKQHTSVEHVRLDHQAHGWPGGPRTTPSTAAFSTTWRTWEFFRSLPPRAPLPS